MFVFGQEVICRYVGLEFCVFLFVYSVYLDARQMDQRNQPPMVLQLVRSPVCGFSFLGCKFAIMKVLCHSWHLQKSRISLQGRSI